MPTHHRPPARRRVRARVAALGTIVAALAAAPTALANSYHVNLNGIDLRPYAAYSAGNTSPTSFYVNNGVSGVELHASNTSIAQGGFGVLTVSAPGGTKFQNSQVSWTTCSSDTSGRYVGIVTDGYTMPYPQQYTDTSASCTNHVFPGVGSFDATQRDLWAVGLVSPNYVALANSANLASFTGLIADVQDNTAPTINNPTLPAYTNNPNLSVPVTVTDNAAGPQTIQAAIDTKTYTFHTASAVQNLLSGVANNGSTSLSSTYTLPLTYDATTPAQGPHTISLWANDAAGNTVSTQAAPRTVVFDSIQPAASNQAHAGDFNTAGWCNTSACRVDVAATDPNLQDWSVSVDGSQATATSTIDLAALGVEGAAVPVAVSASDKAGNTASASRTYKVDLHNPVVTVTAPSGWGQNAPQISVTASDNLSGLETATCTVDGVTTALAGVAVSGEGRHQLSCSASDKAGNTSTASKTILVDQTAPQVSFTPATGWTSQNQLINATATDPRLADTNQGSGVASLSATIDGSPAPINGGALAVTGDGDHVVTLTAIDTAGNIATTTKHVKIDQTAPQVALGSTDPDARHVEIAASDAASGVNQLILAFGSSSLALTATGSHTADGAAIYAATVPTNSAWPADLRGVAMLASASDGAGNVSASLPVSFAARNGSDGHDANGGTTTPPSSPTTPPGTTPKPPATHSTGRFTLTVRDRHGVLSSASRPERANDPVTISGLLTAARPVANAPIVVKLANPAFPQFARTLHAKSGKDGTFKIAVPASLSGAITVSYDGTATIDGATKTAAKITVTPKITAHFTVRSQNGALRPVIVKGRFQPGFGPHVTLRWQVKGRAGWVFVGKPSEQIHVRKNGSFTGRWTPDGSAFPTNLYRLVLDKGSAPYSAAASKASRARIVH